MTVDEAKAHIREIAEAELVGERPVLLSYLGQKLGDKLKALKAMTGNGLTEFITEHLGDEYAIVLSGPYRNIQALVRKGTATDAPPTTGSVPAAVSAPHYHRSFWSAFSLPLRPGARRILDPTTLRFTDVSADEVTGDQLEILPDLVVGQEVIERDNAIAANIALWFKRTGETPARYLVGTRKRPASTKDFQHMTVLDLVIASLDQKQLSSVSMPLDIVSALLKRRV